MTSSHSKTEAPLDLRMLCAALGFLAVAVKERTPERANASRALVLARLMEDFCRMAAPESCEEASTPDELDAMIEEMKADSRAGKPMTMPRDFSLLRQLYARLQQRHRTYATDDLVAEETRHLIEEENHREQEETMRVVDLGRSPNDPHYSRYQNMATAIAGILNTKGECYPEDLEALGFEPEDIMYNWSMAYGLAKVETMFMETDAAGAVS